MSLMNLMRHLFDNYIITCQNKKQQYKKLDMSKLKFSEHSIISTEEALKDVTPIDWPEDVLNGDKKVIISKEGIILKTTKEHRSHG